MLGDTGPQRANTSASQDSLPLTTCLFTQHNFATPARPLCSGEVLRHEDWPADKRSNRLGAVVSAALGLTRLSVTVAVST